MQETEVGDPYQKTRKTRDDSFLDHDEGEIMLFGVSIGKKKKNITPEPDNSILHNDQRPVMLFGVDLRAHSSSSTDAIKQRYREIQEYDFFDDERKGPIRTHLLPPLKKENVFPQIMPPPSRKIDDDDDQKKKKRESVSSERKSETHYFPPVFLFEKKLDAEDVDRFSNRLCITGWWELVWILTEEEMIKVYRKEKRDDFLRVFATDPGGFMHELHLAKWSGKSAFVLDHEWSKVVTANGLQEGDTVEGWWDHRVGRDRELRFALIIKKG